MFLRNRSGFFCIQLCRNLVRVLLILRFPAEILDGGFGPFYLYILKKISNRLPTLVLFAANSTD